MKTFLGTAEMESYIEGVEGRAVGYQYHTNHLDCPSGDDVKRRLYVKRAPDGWMFYCHHCEQRGYYRLRDSLFRADDLFVSPDVRDTTLTDAVIAELSEGVANPVPMSEWPPEARVWWASYGLTGEQAEWYRVTMYNDRLAIPWQGVVYSLRSFSGKGKKWLLFKDKGAQPQERAGTMSRTLVFVEDVVSAIKVLEAGYSVWPLFGTNINTRALSACFNVGRVVLWLDDDVAGQTAAAHIRTQIVSGCTNICYKQPKEVSIDVIKEMIDA